MNTQELKSKAISEIRSTILTLAAKLENVEDAQISERIEALNYLLGELLTEQGGKGVPTEQEIADFARQEANRSIFLSDFPHDHLSVEYGVKKGAQWAISQMQPEPTKHLSDMSVDDFNFIFGDNWAAEYIRKKVEKFSSIKEFQNLLNTIGDFRSYTKAKELGYDVEFSLPQPPTK